MLDSFNRSNIVTIFLLYNKEFDVMRSLFGILLILFGVLFGGYLALYVCIYGGIIQVIEAAKLTPIDSAGVAFGVV